ncbi:hypothetical protein CCP4SC76_2580021 [Gammaproteobacteria bacterium]
MRMKSVIGERDVQKAVLQYLQLCPHIAWAQRFNTGAASSSYTTKEGRTHKRFVRFGFTGCSDIIGQMKSGHLIAIECKRKGGKATDCQEAFLQTVSDSNGLAIIAMNVGDVERAISIFQKSRENPAVITPDSL